MPAMACATPACPAASALAGVSSGESTRPASLDQCRGGLPRIAFERVTIHEQIVIKIEDARLDHIGKNRSRQAILLDRQQKSGSNGVRLAVPMRIAIKKIAPPLHANFTRQRLAHGIADSGNFGIEGIKRGKRCALVGRRQKAREIAVTIGVAQRREADV